MDDGCNEDGEMVAQDGLQLHHDDKKWIRFVGEEKSNT